MNAKLVILLWQWSNKFYLLCPNARTKIAYHLTLLVLFHVQLEERQLTPSTRRTTDNACLKSLYCYCYLFEYLLGITLYGFISILSLNSLCIKVIDVHELNVKVWEFVLLKTLNLKKINGTVNVDEEHCFRSENYFYSRFIE